MSQVSKPALINHQPFAPALYDTAAVVVPALRLYAEQQGIQGWRSAYQIDGWDAARDGIVERLAEVTDWTVAQAAFRAAADARPTSWATLRQGARVIMASDRPMR